MRTPRLIAVLGMSLVLAACGSAPAATPNPTAAAAIATPTPTAQPVPSPTAPPDVVALFASKADSLKSGVINFQGTATVGLVQLTIAGTSRFSGIDSEGRLSTTVAGVVTDVETVQVAGKRYVKTGGGPWLETEVVSGPDLSRSLGTAAKGALRDVATETRNGQVVHKLVPIAGPAFDPAAIVGSVAGVEDVKATLALYAAEDGAPAGAAIEATWTQSVGGKPAEGALSLDLRFSSLGQAQIIRIPDHVWTRFTSSRYHFSLAYPDTWEYEKAKRTELFWAVDFGGIEAHREGADGAPLSSWAKGTLASLKRSFKAKSGSNEEFRLAGVKARLLTVRGKNDSGDKVVVYFVLAVKGKYVYGISWISLAGHEDVDLGTFKDVLSTFAFTP